MPLSRPYHALEDICCLIIILLVAYLRPATCCILAKTLYIIAKTLSFEHSK